MGEDGKTGTHPTLTPAHAGGAEPGAGPLGDINLSYSSVYSGLDNSGSGSLSKGAFCMFVN